MRKVIPKVAVMFDLNSSLQSRIRRLVFPTLESPTNITLYMRFSSSSIIIGVTQLSTIPLYVICSTRKYMQQTFLIEKKNRKLQQKIKRFTVIRMWSLSSWPSGNIIMITFVEALYWGGSRVHYHNTQCMVPR